MVRTLRSDPQGTIAPFHLPHSRPFPHALHMIPLVIFKSSFPLSFYSSTHSPFVVIMCVLVYIHLYCFFLHCLFRMGSLSEEDDRYDEDEAASPTSVIRRGLRSSTSLSRISAVIRRSLRLPSRRSTATLREVARKRTKDEEGGARFTEYSDLRALTYPAIPSRLDEIKENRRLNRTAKVKTIVRKANWPIKHEVRKELWKELCRDKSYDASISVFNDECATAVLYDARSHSPAFLKEDGAVINQYSLTEDGAVRLIRMLAILEQLRPDISSAPILYPLCALLMHYMSDQEAYACAQYLARRGQADRDPPVHLMMTCIEWEASPHVILQLVKKHKTSAYGLLKKKCGTSDEEILSEALREWKTWLFQGLPLSHIVRVIDCFLVEGHKFLLRAAIAVIYMWSKIHKKSSGVLDGKSETERILAVRAELQETAVQCQVSTETFIEMAVLIKNLKGSTINRWQTFFERKVREDKAKGHSRRLSTNVYCFTNPFESSIMPKDLAKRVMARFPSRLQLVTPELLFKLSQDGASFTHLWNKIELAEQTLFIIRSAKKEVFGAYCSSSWAERNDRRERTKSKYFGTGESFVFRVIGEGNKSQVEIYGWVGNKKKETSEHIPQMFMAAGEKLIVIGSGDGDAIRVSEELTHGISSRCSTFDSPPLVEDNAFDINELEVFGVVASES